MAVTTKKAAVAGSFAINEIKTNTVGLSIVGTTPLIMHRFAFKAWQELLMPSQKMNKQAKAESLKHNPLKEYQECMYLNRDPADQALFHVPASMIQEAIAAAALDLPGVTKSEISRWVSVTNPVGEVVQLSVFGVPQMYTTMVRSSDMNRTPDVRTRPIFRQWAIPLVEVTYKEEPLNQQSLINLLSAAGTIVGCGDWRPQKGGSMGKFRICDSSDAELQQIMAAQGRAAQVLAFNNPEYYDQDTEDINLWFHEELARRGKEVEQPVLKLAS